MLACYPEAPNGGISQVDPLLYKLHCLLLTKTLSFGIVIQDKLQAMYPWLRGTHRIIPMSQIQYILWSTDMNHTHHYMANCNSLPKTF